jgi:hypothetical protein
VWHDARFCARRQGTGIRGIGVCHTQAEMQHGAFSALLFRSPAAAFRLNRRPRAEDLKVTPVAGVEKGSPINPPLDGELVADREAEAFGIEPKRTVEIRGPECDVMKSGAGAGGGIR